MLLDDDTQAARLVEKLVEMLKLSKDEELIKLSRSLESTSKQFDFEKSLEILNLLENN